MSRLKRSMTVAAATGLIVCLAQVGVAQADVGDLIVTQYNGSGQALCTQDYVLLNLTPEEITDPDCQGAASANVDNLSVEPIEYSNGTSSGQIGALSDQTISTGGDGDYATGGNVDYPELCFYVGVHVSTPGVARLSVGGIISCGSEADGA